MQGVRVVGDEKIMNFRLLISCGKVGIQSLPDFRTAAILVDAAACPVAQRDDGYTYYFRNVNNPIVGFYFACFQHTAKYTLFRHYAISDLLENGAGGSMAFFPDLR